MTVAERERAWRGKHGVGRESGARLDLLVVGDAVPDVILSGVPARLAYHQVEHLVDSAVLTVGGSAAILACGAARLGLRVAFIGGVGDDNAGRFMREELTARGVRHETWSAVAAGRAASP